MKITSHERLQYWKRSMADLSQEWVNEDTRMKYLEALFDKVDQDRTKRIKIEELGGRLPAYNPYSDCLKYFQKEGVDASSFAFNIAQDASPDDIVKAVMDEFDYGRTGYLTQAEFYALADTVLKEYTLHKEYAGVVDQVIGPYHLTRTLGFGTMGVVKFARSSDTGLYHAVKVIRRSSNYVVEGMIDAEIEALEKVGGHDNIVRITEALETDTHVFLVLDLCGGGTILDHMLQTPFTAEVSRFYFRQMVNAVTHMHHNGVAHRDLRLENILLDNEGNIKVCDFGHAQLFDSAAGFDAYSGQTVGSTFFQTPEQVARRVCSGRAVDMWCLGVVLHCLLLHRRPFVEHGASQLAHLHAISNVTLDLPDDMDPGARDLVLWLLSKDPGDRPTIAMVAHHPWLDGPVARPAIARSRLVIESSRVCLTDDDYLKQLGRLWGALHRVMLTFPVVMTKPDPDERLSRFHVRCEHQVHDLLFGIALNSLPVGQDGQPVGDIQNGADPEQASQTDRILAFDFYMRRGETWNFQKIARRIRAEYLKMYEGGGDELDVGDGMGGVFLEPEVVTAQRFADESRARKEP